ncbi:uncharacterized protein [Cicer arietinum]|uniref:uncharacterized protein isoform X1 n=1 Tax=Cicer arietinum TaxID=3827 RepID=UPI003CC6027F
MSFGSIREAYKNTSTLGYLNSAQALADHAHMVIHLKETLQAQKSLVIVIGGSYCGRKGTMFQPDPFNMKNFGENCNKKFGYTNLPRPRWITTYYGGQGSE